MAAFRRWRRLAEEGMTDLIIKCMGSRSAWMESEWEECDRSTWAATRNMHLSNFHRFSTATNRQVRMTKLVFCSWAERKFLSFEGENPQKSTDLIFNTLPFWDAKCLPEVSVFVFKHSSILWLWGIIHLPDVPAFPRLVRPPLTSVSD